MIVKGLIALAALAMPVSALAEDVPVDIGWIDATRAVPICRALTDRSVASGAARETIEAFDQAMRENGISDNTRAMVFAFCAAYANGRVDGLNRRNSF